MLRESVSPDLAQPSKGINLREPAHQLMAGEVVKLQNLYWDGFIRLSPGSTLHTSSVITAGQAIRGGTRFYPTDALPVRLIATEDAVYSVGELGEFSSIGVITSGITNVFFTTWSISSSVYIVDGVSSLLVYDGLLFESIVGTNIPIAKGPIVPILDRLLGITDDGIERTDSRVDDVWSANSSWATFRPERPGKFIALHPYSIKGTDTIYPGVLALQQSAYYHITGTDFGTDVTSATASSGENSAITIIDSQVGTSSPKSIVTVPGIGTLWFTSDKNIYWIPEGQLSGKFVGDKLFSNGTTQGLESVNTEALGAVWMDYFDRKLILGVPMGASTFVNTQFFLDLRTLSSALDAPAPAWYGPMTMDTWGCVWREDQQGELRLMAGEGNASNGAYVYNTYLKNTASHYQGATEVFPIAIYQDRHNAFRRGQQSKHVQDIRLTAFVKDGLLKAGLLDLGSEVMFPQEVVVYHE